MSYLNEWFKLHNNIDFEIQNLSLDMKFKEIQRYNPFHYIFGRKLISNEWLNYEDR